MRGQSKQTLAKGGRSTDPEDGVKLFAYFRVFFFFFIPFVRFLSCVSSVLYSEFLSCSYLCSCFVCSCLVLSSACCIHPISLLPFLFYVFSSINATCLLRVKFSSHICCIFPENFLLFWLIFLFCLFFSAFIHLLFSCIFLLFLIGLLFLLFFLSFFSESVLCYFTLFPFLPANVPYNGCLAITWSMIPCPYLAVPRCQG